MRPTGKVGGFRNRLKHLIALPDPVDHLATPLATSPDVVTVAGTQRASRPTATSAEPPSITRASRR